MVIKNAIFSCKQYKNILKTNTSTRTNINTNLQSYENGTNMFLQHPHQEKHQNKHEQKHNHKMKQEDNLK